MGEKMTEAVDAAAMAVQNLIDREHHKGRRATAHEIREVLRSHLTQPAQAVDVVDVVDVADALESEYLAIANGEKKPGKLLLEPLVRAVQTLRALHNANGKEDTPDAAR